MKILSLSVTAALCIFFPGRTISQELILPEGFPEFTIDQWDHPEDGYFFICPQPMTGLSPGHLVIMDNYGTPVFYRKIATKAYCFQPYPNGYLAYFEGSIRKYVMMDSAYNIIDTMQCKGCELFDLHEILILENGNYLLAGKTFRTVDMGLIVTGGDPEATIEDYLIQEFDPEGNLVFEWPTELHYAITDVNNEVDLTASSIDVTNFNAIVVESDTSLLLSMAQQDEITKIDRRTGDVIWRLGGKNNEFDFINSTRPFTRQHHVRKLPNNNITLFDNGTFSDPDYARAVEYEIDEGAMTVTQVWEYDHGKDISSSHKGSVQRLPGGNTLIGWGDYTDHPAVPAFTEVKPDGSAAIEVSFPVHDGSYRVMKFPWKTSLFEANTDSVDFGMWDGYTHSVYVLKIRNNSDSSLTLSNYHVRKDAFFFADGLFPVDLAPMEEKRLHLLYFPVNIDSSCVEDVLTINSDIHNDTLTQRIAIQVHLSGSKHYSGNNTMPPTRMNGFSFYPNPARDYIILCTNHKSGSLRFFDLQGALIHRVSFLNDGAHINISGIPVGAYVVEFRDNRTGDTFRKTIMKTR